MESVDQLAELIEICQKSPHRKPSMCYKCKEGVLRPVILQGRERYILMQCPSCEECRALGFKEAVAFRVMGELFKQFPVNLQGEGNEQ